MYGIEGSNVRRLRGRLHGTAAAVLALCASVSTVVFPAGAQSPLRGADSVPAVALITGTVVGSDGRPMPLAHVRLRQVRSLDPDGGPESALARVDDKGRFALASTMMGGVAIEFSGPHHERRTAFAVLTPGFRLTIHARLARIAYRPGFDSVRVVGDFNGFRSDTSARALFQDAGGRWVLDIPTTSDSVAYALVGIALRGSVPGTPNDRYIRMPSGAYRSVTTTYKGIARIVVDPGQLVQDSTPEHVDYAGGAEARIARLTDSILSYQVLAARAEEDQHPMDSAAWRPRVLRAIRSLDGERNGRVRGMLYLELLSLVQLGGNAPSSVGVGALRDLPPSSPLWASAISMMFGLPFVALRVADDVVPLFRGNSGRVLLPEDSLRLQRYAMRFTARLDSMIAATDDDFTRAQWLQFGVAVTDGVLPEQAARYLGRMQAEYPTRVTTIRALQVWGRNRKLRPGVPMPAIDVGALGDTARRITNAQFAGKWLLVDFWATWCLPCLNEMPVLHDAYAEFKSRGLEILSISLDGQMADVAAFRSKRWAMPWQHAWVTGALEAKELKALDLYGIPHIVLIDPNGMVVAEDRDLRGAALRRTLERLLK